MKATYAALMTMALAAPTLAQPIPITSGGVAESGRATLSRQEEQYSLKLVLVGQEGMYLSNVAVSILDANGKEVVNTATDGPFLLAGLPAGQYKVEADAEGFHLTQQINITGVGLRTYYLRFPVTDEPDIATPVEPVGYHPPAATANQMPYGEYAPSAGRSPISAVPPDAPFGYAPSVPPPGHAPSSRTGAPLAHEPMDTLPRVPQPTQ